MNFSLTDEQEAIFSLSREFGEKNIAPFAHKWERDGTIPTDLWVKTGQLGFGAINVTSESGGSELSRLDGTLIFEALARSCPSVAAFLSIHNMCAWMIDTFGEKKLKKKYLQDAVSMHKVFSYCLTETSSGSDAAALSTKAKRNKNGWEINGVKSFISGGGYSDAYIVMCRTNGVGPSGISTLVVDADAPGLTFGSLEEKMGWRAQPTRQVIMDNCQVTTDSLLGKEGAGFRYAMAGLDGGRLNIAACSLGASQAAFEKTLTYMNERKAFGKSLHEFQALQFRLADMETELQSARLMLRYAACKLDQKAHDATAFCAMAKRLVTDTGFKVANECLQLYGGYGYLTDYGIEKIVRDLRVHQILEGTNEIMRLIIFRKLMTEFIT